MGASTWSSLMRDSILPARFTRLSKILFSLPKSVTFAWHPDANPVAPHRCRYLTICYKSELQWSNGGGKGSKCRSFRTITGRIYPDKAIRVGSFLYLLVFAVSVRYFSFLLRRTSNASKALLIELSLILVCF